MLMIKNNIDSFQQVRASARHIGHNAKKCHSLPTKHVLLCCTGESMQVRDMPRCTSLRIDGQNLRDAKRAGPLVYYTI